MTSLRIAITLLLPLAAASCAAAPREDPSPPPPSPAHGSPPPALRARPAGGLRADFDPAGAVIHPSDGAGWAFRATPWALGRDGAMTALGEPALEVRGDRVTYVRPGLDEWYVRGLRGVEQGFTLAAPPPCPRAGCGGVVIALGGGLDVAVGEGRREARLRDASGAEVLRYADLRVVDAAGRDLPATIEARGEGLAIRFDDVGAPYPVVVDPTMTVQNELTPLDEGPMDDFGCSVAMSGGTLVVGADFHGYYGAAYFYVGGGATWALQQEIDGSQTQNDSFGQAVAVSGDTALVGSPGMGSGTATFFVRSGTTWAQTQQLLDVGSSFSDAFGSAVALDGDTALVAAPGASNAYAYARSNGTWTFQQDVGALLGSTPEWVPALSVALSGDTAIVGMSSPGTNAAGVAGVLVRSGGVWALQQMLSAPDQSFGAAAAIEGDTAVVGAPYDGATYVFTRSGSVWTQTQKLTPASSYYAFGTAVAIGGGVVAIGAQPSMNGPGEVDVFAPSGGSLAPAYTTNAGAFAAMGDQFGASVAVNGGTLVAGAPLIGGGAAFARVRAAADGDPCASAMDCLDGHCVDGVCCTVAACPPASACTAAEHCQPGTGKCSHTPINAGMACKLTAELCVGDATCRDGVCVGDAKLCPPTDACHEFGTCDPESGACSTPEKPDGVACPGGACQAGVCVPSGGASSSSGGAPGPTPSAGGCGCGIGGAPAGQALGAVAALLLLARRRRAR